MKIRIIFSIIISLVHIHLAYQNCFTQDDTIVFSQAGSSSEVGVNPVNRSYFNFNPKGENILCYTHYNIPQYPGSFINLETFTGKILEVKDFYFSGENIHSIIISDNKQIATIVGTKDSIVVSHQIDYTSNKKIKDDTLVKMKINYFKISDDGKSYGIIGSGTIGPENKILIYDVETRTLKYNFSNDTIWSYSIAFTNDPDIVILLQYSKLIFLNLKTRQYINEISCPGVPINIEITRDNRRVILWGGSAGEIIVYDVQTGKKLWQSTTYLKINNLCLTDDSKKLIYPTEKGFVVLNIENGDTLFYGLDDCFKIAYKNINNQDYIATQGSDINLWNLSQRVMVKKLSHNNKSFSFICTPVNHFAIEYIDNVSKIMDVVDLSNSKIIRHDSIFKTKNIIKPIKYLQDLNQFYYLTEENNLIVRDLYSNIILSNHKLDSKVTDAIYNYDKTICIIEVSLRYYEVWDWRDQTKLYNLDSLRLLKLSPKGKYCILHYPYDDKNYVVYLIELLNGNTIFKFIFALTSSPKINFTYDENYIYIKENGKNFQCFDISKRNFIKEFKSIDTTVLISEFLLTRDGKKLIAATYSHDSTMILIDLERDSIVHIFRNYFGVINKLLLSFDEKNIAYQTSNNSIIVEKIKDGILSTINDFHHLMQNYHIFPNPAGEYIEIKDVRAEHALPLQDIKIYNLLGECVMSAGGAKGTHPFVPSQEGNIRIDVSGLPAGLYFIRLGDCVGRFLKI
jgi:hypothetical protein